MVHRTGAGTVEGSGSGWSRMIAVMVSAALSRRKARFPDASLVKDQAKGELIAAMVQLAAARLFGTHIIDRSDDHAWLGDRRRC